MARSPIEDPGTPEFFSRRSDAMAAVFHPNSLRIQERTAAIFSDSAAVSG